MKKTDYKNLKRSELTKTIQRHLIDKEKFLGSKCRKIWSMANPKGGHFIFGKFVKNRTDETIVTLAAWHTGCGWIASR